MLNADSITRRATELLTLKGLKSELSEQAKSVILAITYEINAQLLESQAETQRQINAVKETPTGRMKKPTRNEVLLHGNNIELPESECNRFFDHFESNGWRVGQAKTPMKLWTAAMANWKRTWQERISGGVNGNVAAIRDQKALERVEDRIKYLRGQMPLNEKLKIEWNELKIERTRLMKLLNFKV